jgi:hypothetical protein
LKSLFAGAALDFNAALRTGKNYMPSKDRVKMLSLSWALQKHIGLLVKINPPNLFSFPTAFGEKTTESFVAQGLRLITDHRAGGPLPEGPALGVFVICPRFGKI